MADLVVADLHLRHANIIKYCDRPFDDVEQMNEALINNWNSVVSPGDTVYLVGDFGFGRYDDLKPLFDKLNGTSKTLILGNHDRMNVVRNMGWSGIHQRMTVPTSYGNIILSHRPNIKSLGGAICCVHGHTHNVRQDDDIYCCCSVEMINYTPVLLDDLVGSWLEKRKT